MIKQNILKNSSKEILFMFKLADPVILNNGRVKCSHINMYMLKVPLFWYKECNNCWRFIDSFQKTLHFLDKIFENLKFFYESFAHWKLDESFRLQPRIRKNQIQVFLPDSSVYWRCKFLIYSILAKNWRSLIQFLIWILWIIDPI